MADYRDDFIIAIRYALLKKGAKQKFSLFFLILLSISIISIDKFLPKFMAPIRSILNDVVYHTSVVSSQPTVFRKYIVKTSEQHYKLLKKNKFLESELHYLNQEKFNNVFLKTENEILKEALDLSNNNQFERDFSISARVILDQSSPFLKSILINKGTNSGITKGMAVFSNDYLMGIVIETNYLTSRVLLLTDLNSKLPVVIAESNTNAILEGTGNQQNLRLSYLPATFVMESNKIIFTSGKDGFLSPGIPVAQTYLNKKNKILIKLLGDPDQALIVNVVGGSIKKEK